MEKVRIAIPEIAQDVTNYVYAVAYLGGEPVVISDTAESGFIGHLEWKKAKLDDFDGLILPGGVDVDPARYGQPVNGSEGIRKDLDALQFEVLDAFVRAKKPVFGICRGHQVINVYFGGTLHQDIPTSARHNRDYPPRLNPDKCHEVHAKPSWISRLYGERFAVNSAHHQAVGNPGNGLLLDSWCCDDEVVEALHHETLPIWSVQWHPERMCCTHARPDTVDGSEVLKFFLEKCGEKS